MMVNEEIGSYDAKTKLSEILRKVQKGQSFTITKHGKPVADVVPSRSTSHQRTLDAIEDILKIQGKTVADDVIKASIEDGRK
jgi:prevent-host-death family protein